ncbi:MAG TPA: biopolymer transporter Tol [Isosphaeraceae bacterium]
MRAALLGLALVAGTQPAAPERLTHDGQVKRRPSWSPDGKRLAFARHESGDTHIWQYVMDAGKPGSARRITRRETPDYDAAFTPDGKQFVLVTVAQSGTQGNLDVVVVAAEGGEPKTIVGDVGGKLAHAEWPSPSPDGKRLAYTSTHEGNQEVYVAKIDGTDPVRLTQSPGVDAHPCWTPDGRSIVFATDRWGGLELAVVRADGTGLRRLTRSPGLDDYPAVSPDGKRLAFATNRDGNLEVYVSALDGSRPVNVSSDPGVDTMPTWTPDGRGVTFVSSRAAGFDLYTVPVAP